MHPATLQAHQDILAKCSLFGATPDFSSWKGNLKPFSIRCRCGAVFEKRWSNLQKENCLALCSTCSTAHIASRYREIRIPKTEAKIKEKCASVGSTYVEGSHILGGSGFSVRCGCGTVFQSTVQNFLSDRQRGTCSSCSYKSNTGPLCSSWNPALSEEERNRRRSREFIHWSRAVLHRYDYTCAISGLKGVQLASHHIFSFGSYPDLRYDVSNGVAISRGLHKEFHDSYGYGDNTLEQFKEFFYIKTQTHFSSESTANIVRV